MSDWLDLAIPLVAHFEGCQKKRDGLVYPYLDTLAKPPVWTRGYGRTYGITEGSPGITPDEARRELGAGLSAYAVKCLKLAPALATRPECLAAVVSWSWNCGIGALCVSRLRIAINGEKWETAQTLLKKPRTAGGVEYLGLVRRREAEAALFERGIKNG